MVRFDELPQAPYRFGMRLGPGLVVAAFVVGLPAPSWADEPAGDEPASEEPPVAVVPAPEPSPKPAAPSPKKAASPKGKARGAIIVAIGPESRPAARALARRAYQEPQLRPAIDEPTALVLAGGEPPEDDAKLVELAATVHALEHVADDTVRRRLAASLGRELGAERVVLVEHDERGPRARVVENERYLAVVLAADASDEGWDWSDAVAMLRGLSASAPAPGPRSKPAPPLPTPKPPPILVTPESPEDGDESSLLTNPWFWTGISLVVSVGVTVIVLSQTTLNEPDVVRIEGKVGP